MIGSKSAIINKVKKYGIAKAVSVPSLMTYTPNETDSISFATHVNSSCFEYVRNKEPWNHETWALIAVVELMQRIRGRRGGRRLGAPQSSSIGG